MLDKISTASVPLFNDEPYRPRRRPLAENTYAVIQPYDVPARRRVRGSPESGSDLRREQTQRIDRYRYLSSHPIEDADPGLPTASAVSGPARYVRTHQVSSRAQDDDTPSDLRRLEKGWRERRRNRVLEPALGFRLGEENSVAGGNWTDQDQEQEQYQIARTKEEIAQSGGGPISIASRQVRPPQHDRQDHLRTSPSLSSAFPHDAYNKIPLRPRARTNDYPIINNDTRIEQKPNVRFSSSPPSILPTPPSTPPPPPPPSAPTQTQTQSQTTHLATRATPPPQERDLAGRHPQAGSPYCPSPSSPFPRQNAGTGRLTRPSSSRPQSPSNRAALPHPIRPRIPYPPETYPVKRPIARAKYDLRAAVPSRTSPASKIKLKPILAHPLPPTPRPVPLSKGYTDFIYIYPPASPLELSLYLGEGRVIEVSRGGQKAVFTHGGEGDRDADEDEDEDEDGNGRTKYTRVIRLEDRGTWSKEERRDWENLSGVVENFKRITPRIKLYHPLGHLTITCSSPPDVILTFQLEFRPRPIPALPNTVVDRLGALGAAQARPRPRNADSRGVPSVEADSSPQAPPRPSLSRTRETCERDLIKVRIRYSRAIDQLRIDTERGRSGVIEPERYRTKRSVALDCIASQTSDKPLPPASLPESPLATTRRQDTSTRSQTLQQAATTSPDLGAGPGSGSAGHIDMENASLFLGLRSDLRGWREEEREALRRLWALRGEWLRWG
ncbi:hypothetical protein IAU59_000037 [Kwoniella sp. CBS 9459]